MTKKKANIDDIIAHKVNLEVNDSVEFDSKELGGTVTIKKMPRAKFQEFLAMGKNAKTKADESAIEDRIIYESIPFLQNPKLIKAYEVVAPYDIVSKIFNDNLIELTQIRTIIFDWFGITSEVIDNLKK